MKSNKDNHNMNNVGHNSDFTFIVNSYLGNICICELLITLMLPCILLSTINTVIYYWLDNGCNNVYSVV